MKKTNNKGFSLVELIIVIAIMAILAGAIAPALIRYIDKSRRSNDVTAAKTIKTAVETALGNESVYELITTGAGDYCYIVVTPGLSTAADETDALRDDYPVQIYGEGEGDENGLINGKDVAAIEDVAQEEIGVNIGEKTPKLKFKKNAADKESDNIPTGFVAVVSKKGTVYVYIAVGEDAPGEDWEIPLTTGDKPEPTSDKDTGFQICPVTCDEYQ